ncbi:MAG TPA: hypothetical protein VFH56_11235, partial [Acidimicrobiales bacterium]|nr:hypothetical protein [Acidimicrobiales bacterium]
PAKGAVLVLVNLAVGYLAGFLAKDPLRNLGAAFDNNPATAPSKRNEAGEVSLPTLVPVMVLATLVLVALMFCGVHA